MPRTFPLEVAWLDRPIRGLIRAGVRRTDGETLQARAGQFFMMHFEHDGKRTNRSYSIANPVDGPSESVELCIALVPDGAGSSLVDTWDVGTTFDATGPHGRFILRETDEHLVLIATGTGIAPYNSMYHGLVERLEAGHHVRVVHGVRTSAELVYDATFTALSERYEHFSYDVCLSREAPSPEIPNANVHTGRIQAVLESFLTAQATYFLCGNPEMVQDVKKRLGELGVERPNIRTESYTSPVTA